MSQGSANNATDEVVDRPLLDYVSMPTDLPPKWHPAVVTTLGWVVTILIAAILICLMGFLFIVR